MWLRDILNIVFMIKRTDTERYTLSLKRWIDRHFPTAQSVFRRARDTHILARVVVVTLLVVTAGWFSFLGPPSDFPVGAVVSVEDGLTFSQIADELQIAGVIRSPFALRVFIALSNGDRSLRSGDYFFVAPRNVIDVARRLLSGDFGITPMKVTVPEGLSRVQLAEFFAKRFDRFDVHVHLALVIHRAARVNVAIADGRFKRRRSP